MESISLYLILGSLTMGFITGVIDLIYGLRKNDLKFGIIGFIACIISGFLFGALLAVPVCIVFLWLIRRNFRKQSEFS
ncbi:MAG: hypothetical protein ACPK7O_06420 [Methanobacterium sp.]